MVSFNQPSYRAAQSDLAISVSPLGLIELSDEEFEVHGPRLNRYSTNWAFYLGHHWGYRREAGEANLTFNYTKAFADYITNFTFGRGVDFKTPKQTEHIVPNLLERVWSVDNHKRQVLWRMGQTGGVTGDCFVKVAYEDPFADPSGRTHPGRVRIIPLNSAFCLPVEDTEVLTQRGWLSADELTTEDKALSLDPETDTLTWADVEGVNVFDWDGPVARWEGSRFSALTTPDHRWVSETGRGTRSMRTTQELHDIESAGQRLVVAGGTPAEFPEVAKWSDDFVELVGWFVTEGHWHSQSGAPMLTQDAEVNPEYAARIDRIMQAVGASRYEYEGRADQWYAPALKESLFEVVGAAKELTPEFLTSLTFAQARLLYETLIDADGCRSGITTFSQSDEGRVAGFQMLAMMLGIRTHARWRTRDIGVPNADVTAYQGRHVYTKHLDRTWERFTGKVWCPTTSTGTWVARRKGQTFHTGNCFPEFHPHDRDRLIRFKLKYRFWGCVDTDTEVLTSSGWKRYDEVTEDDSILSRNPTTDAIQWEKPQAINVYDNAGAPMVRWQSPGIDAVTTMNHRWLADTPKYSEGSKVPEYVREMVRTSVDLGDERAVKNTDRILTGGGVPLAFATAPKFDDEFVETVAWFVTEGWVHTNQTGTTSAYLAQKRPEGLRRLRRVGEYWRQQGATFSEYAPKSDGVVTFYLGKGVKEALFEHAPDKRITPEFLTSLTPSQAELFRDTLLLADGNVRRGSTRWTQTDLDRVDGYQMLCAMLGIGTRYADEKVQEYARGYLSGKTLRAKAHRVEDVQTVWCPTLSEETGVWMARRNGVTYWTGNTAPDGTRQVFTYTEILTDSFIEEYVNDEMIDQRENPLGTIPIAHIANVPVEGSPWGLSDIQDILSLNREYNEKATDISDIINYHAKPVTIVKGAKVGNLTKGADKVWAGLPKDADVYHLEMQNNLQAPMMFMEALKRSMHEMTGVPETALGQKQAVSNTSGVALAIEYQPLMNRFHIKTMQYGKGLEHINELVLLTLAVKEPQAFQFNPTEVSEVDPAQPLMLDLTDPLTYRTEVDFPPPLPTDELILLNEVQAKMALGLESKKGALKKLGEAFPDEVLAEVFEEQREDLLDQGALDLLRAHIQANIMQATGMQPGDGGPIETEEPGPDGTTQRKVPAMEGPSLDTILTSGTIPGLDPDAIMANITTTAFGTKLAQRRMPSADGDE